MKASNAQEGRPSNDDAVPQQKLDERQWKDTAGSSDPTHVANWNSHDAIQNRLPERLDKPWLVVGIAAAFSVMFAGLFYSVLK